MTESLAPPVTEFRTAHPKGLWVLFFSELWERFSFYGMRALLVLYMTSDILRYGAEASYGVYAAYGALVYASPILGGYLADKIMGTRRAIVLGGLLMALGHFAMAITDERQIAFYSALGLLCVGNGFFKPNISTTVGRLYAQGDIMKDKGFVLFYMGINIGAFSAPLFCGWLGETYGWHFGFGAAGVGMLLGLIVFMRGQRHLEGQGEPVDPSVADKWHLPIYLMAFAASFLFGFMINHNDVVEWILLALYAVVMIYILYIAFTAESRVQRDRVFLFLILALFHTVFWGLFEQAGSSLTLYANFCVDKYGLKTSMWQAWNPLFIVCLGPLFNMLWPLLDKKNKNPSIPGKFGIALVWLGLGFYILVPGAATVTPPEVFVPGVFLILLYFLHTTGELCLSPVGLAAVTKLAPAAAGAFFMGAWFLSISAGHFVAGVVAKATGDVDKYQIAVSLDDDFHRRITAAERSDDKLTKEELSQLGSEAAIRLTSFGIDPAEALKVKDDGKDVAFSDYIADLEVPTEEDKAQKAIDGAKDKLLEAINKALPIRFFMQNDGSVDLAGLLAFNQEINDLSKELEVDVEPKNKIPLREGLEPETDLVRTSVSRMENKIELVIPRLQADGSYNDRIQMLIDEGVANTYIALEQEAPTESGEGTSGLVSRVRDLQSKMLTAFTGVYEMGGIISIALGVLLFLLAPMFNRLGHGVK